MSITKINAATTILIFLFLLDKIFPSVRYRKTHKTIKNEMTFKNALKINRISSPVKNPRGIFQLIFNPFSRFFRNSIYSFLVASLFPFNEIIFRSHTLLNVNGILPKVEWARSATMEIVIIPLILI
ncbi:hypothetical protein KAU51_04895 [Candidatus Parcubacteria bacterium]|nr:hypothetical protein [Candidatus Parcubacteria bacterium]